MISAINKLADISDTALWSANILHKSVTDSICPIPLII
jgi:hypothetical protein